MIVLAVYLAGVVLLVWPIAQIVRREFGSKWREYDSFDRCLDGALSVVLAALWPAAVAVGAAWWTSRAVWRFLLGRDLSGHAGASGDTHTEAGQSRGDT